MKLYITRHSKTKWNEEHRLQGWKDSPLTKEGIEDAKRLKQRLQTIPIDVYIASPITRAKETAHILSNDVIFDDRLKEMHFGDYEGRKVKEICNTKEYYELWHHPTESTRLPNGESLYEVRHRVANCLDDLYKQYANKTVFLTVHGMVFVVLLSIVKDLSLEQLTSVNTIIRGCSLSHFTYDGKNYTIHYVGDDSHLPALKDTISYSK